MADVKGFFKYRDENLRIDKHAKAVENVAKRKKKEEELANQQKLEELKRQKIEREFRFRKRDLNLNLFVTPNKKDVHYLYEYVPTRVNYVQGVSNWTQELIDYKSISEDILVYKNNSDPEITTFFTEEIMKGISRISSTYFDDFKDIALVSVPSSLEKGSSIDDSQTAKSINFIEELCEEGITKYSFNCSHNIHDFSDLLYRNSTISSQKTVSMGVRNDKERQLDSISCSRESIPNDFAYIILDDVTTSGTSMDACRDKLISLGIKRDQIICFAIAETIWTNDELELVNDMLSLNKERISI